MNFKSDAVFAQRFLSCAGLYKGEIDGLYGKMSAKAEADFNKLFVEYADQYGRFDDRTEGNISTLLPKVQVAARKALVAVKPLGLTVQILSGTRTYAEQAALFKQRPKVTNANAGQSNHNFGIAFDIGIFKGKTYYTGATKAQEQAYIDASKLILPTVKELDWGGLWKFVDRPHYEVKSNYSTAQKRAMFEKGQAFV